MKLRIAVLFLAVCLIFTGCYYSTDTVSTLSPVGEEAIFHFIDVGQGDCTLIQTKDSTVLIDSGTGESANALVNYLDSVGVKHLDCFILTHPHEDHMGGSANVLKFISADKVITNGEDADSYFFENFLDVMIKKDITPKLLTTDCTYNYGGLKIKFLSPLKDYDDTNNNSIVTMVSYGETRALFMGDAEKDVENDLLKSTDIDADILKVGHHGSRNASGDSFLKKVSAKICVIQCGKDNSYGHPHKEALSRIERTGAQILRTDLLGTVILRTDGKNIFDSNGEIYDIEINPESLEYIYIGNKKSKVLHTDTCPNLPGEKNKMIFKNREEAINKGYKVCGNCNP